MSGKPQIIFVPHALYQVKERGLDENEIVAVVRNPDKVIRQADGRFRALKIIKAGAGSYSWVVVYEKHNSTIKIITSFLTSKIKKYLQL